MAKMDIGSTESYLAILAYLQAPDGPPPKQLLSSLGALLDHLSYSFAIVGSQSLICEISLRTHLRICSAKKPQNDFSIVSGTLSQWYAAITEFCSISASHDLRLLYDAIMLYFEKIGLKSIWRNYRKEPQKDKTFILEERK